MRRLHLVPLITAAAVLVLALALFSSTRALAQNAGGPTDNSQLSKEERFYNGMREQLDVTDDAEWKTLLPKIVKVQALTRYARDVHDSRRIRRSFRNADPNNPPPYYLKDLADRAAEVRAAYEDKDAHPNTIKQALKGYREARDKADKELTSELEKAREELRDLVTARQELTLIMTGLLD
jgi:Spy/CpxP family protein refolding chaperone